MFNLGVDNDPNLVNEMEEVVGLGASGKMPLALKNRPTEEGHSVAFGYCCHLQPREI